VIRGINRKTKRQRVDDWIVPDDQSEEGEIDWPPSYLDGDGHETDPDDIEFCRRAVAKANATQSDGDSAVERVWHDFGNRLTNAILLTGPTGCGKTAAVYACAEELGWEIFEVNPGTGKRSAASLDNLVGEVGKNHLVRTAKYRSGNVKDGILHASRVAKHGKLRKQLESLALGGGNQGEPDEGELSKTGDLAVGKTIELEARGKARQSLILLEEVDILFEKDTNFWPAVISLIEQCRRPVIMTCNGKSPYGDIDGALIVLFS
jgi:hypothetical protein